MTRSHSARWLALACASASVTAAHAQTVREALFDSEIPDAARAGRNVGVLERPHPGYDPIGVPVGAFLVFPRLDAGPGYDSNVLGTRTGQIEDGYAAISPSIFATSNWGRHQLTASVGADLREYATQTTENMEAWHVQADGRLDVIDEDSVTGGVEARKLYSERNSGFYPAGAAGPVGYTKVGGYARYNRQTGRFRWVASADTYDYSYDPVAQLGGGTLDQSFNDQRTSRFSLRNEFGFTPDSSLFGQFSHVIKDFHVASKALDRSSTEERFLLGATTDLTGLIRGSVGVGYIDRSYDLPQFQAVSGVALDASLQYFATTLTTFGLTARRTVEDSLDFNVSGFFDTQLKARVDHELLRNCIIGAAFTYENDDYRGVSRSDDIYTYQISGRYALSRYVSLAAEADYITRNTSGAQALGPVFDETRFVLTATFQI